MSDRPDRFKYDTTSEAWFYRMVKLQTILVERGGFKPVDAMNILVGMSLTGSEKTDSEKAAKWLRKEIAHRRKLEKQGEGAAVLRALAMSPTDISDLAITMLEALPDRPGPPTLSIAPWRKD